MKKALLAALCFILVSLVMVNGTFALPDLDKVFADLTSVLGEMFGNPEIGGAGTTVDVALVADGGSHNLFPGGAVSRAYHVKNEGSGDVYFRLVYAIQYEEDSWDHLKIDFDAGEGFTGPVWKKIWIDNTPYMMAVFTYTGTLVERAESPEVTLSIAMDSTITSQQIARYRSDFLKAQVLAIEPGPFLDEEYTVEEALELALPLDTLNPF